MTRITLGLAVLCLCIISFQAFAADMGPSVDKLSAHEKSLWEAIKNGDMKTFSAGTSDEILDIDASGVIYNKQQIIDSFSKMKMTDYSLSDFKTYMLDKDCVVLTYTANSTITMNEKSMTPKTIDSTTYVQHGGKWIPKFHTETMVPPAPAQ